MQTGNSLEKTLMLGKIKGRRRRGCQAMGWLDGITDAKNMNLGKLWEMVRDVLQSMGSQRVGHNWATEQQQQRCSAPLCVIIITSLNIHLPVSSFPAHPPHPPAK